MAKNQHTKGKKINKRHCGWMSVCQKLGINLENKVVQKLKLGNIGFFYQKMVS